MGPLVEVLLTLLFLAIVSIAVSVLVLAPVALLGIILRKCPSGNVPIERR